MKEMTKNSIEQQQIDRLIDTLEAYKKRKYPLDLTETEMDILIRALITRAGALDLMARYSDDGK